MSLKRFKHANKFCHKKRDSFNYAYSITYNEYLRFFYANFLNEWNSIESTNRDTRKSWFFTESPQVFVIWSNFHALPPLLNFQRFYCDFCYFCIESGIKAIHYTLPQFFPFSSEIWGSFATNFWRLYNLILYTID